MRSLALLPAITALAFAQNWPQFRGDHASGIADSQNLPLEWTTQWKTPIPGLAHSSPIIWADRIFLTTAISADQNSIFEPIAKGPVDYRTDLASHQCRVL